MMKKSYSLSLALSSISSLNVPYGFKQYIPGCKELRFTHFANQLSLGFVIPRNLHKNNQK